MRRGSKKPPTFYPFVSSQTATSTYLWIRHLPAQNSSPGQKKPWKRKKHLSYHISWLKTGALFDWVMLWIYATHYFYSIYIGGRACFLIDAVLMSVIAFFPTRRRRRKKQSSCVHERELGVGEDVIYLQLFKIIIMAFQIIFNTNVIICINNVYKVKSC